MTLKPGQIYVRNEPKNDPYDEVRVVAPSPLAEGEWVFAAVNPFSGADGTPVSVSATADSLHANYVYDRETETHAPAELGRNAIGAWNGLD